MKIDEPLGVASYGRLFPDLPPFSANEDFLFALGGTGGLSDAGGGDDAPASLGNVAAGWPFFGQFVGHDITADRSAPTPHADLVHLRNARFPRLDLECLYGDGPVGHPFLYSRKHPAKLLTAVDGDDVLRNAEGTAIIADPRNDSHVIMSQMHLAFARAHNAFVDHAQRAGFPEADWFESAARELRWHYQTAILDEYLPLLIGQRMRDELVTDGCKYFRPDREVFIPLEFADAAFRYGHSQVRHRYVLHAHGESLAMLPDLLGFRAVPPDRRVDWNCFFDAPGAATAQHARRIDGRLVHCLIELPAAMTGASEIPQYHSLAVRDLERGQGVGLPSGEVVARHLGATPLSSHEVGAERLGWSGETPLWYYILREADVRCDGDGLGPVGGRIVGEVLVGLLDCDPTSVRFAPPDWRPTAMLLELLLGHIRAR